MKPYYSHAGVTIYHGDCRDVLPSLGPVDLVLTDPPYNVGKKYGGHGDSMPPSAYTDWLRDVFARCALLSPELVYFPGLNNLLDAGDLIGTRTGLRPVRVLGWHKREFAGDLFSAGPAICWEPIVWASRSEKPYCNKLYGHAGRDFLVVDSTHGDPFKGPHPCPKPLKVMRWLVNLFAPDGGTVLDPFAGSGTTLEAAKALGRRAVGVEREERFCELAVKRLSQEVFEFAEAVYPMATYGSIRFHLKQAFPSAPTDLLDSWITGRHERIMSALNWDHLNQSRPLATVAEYTTGQVQVSNGSVIVSGSGTDWNTDMGDLLRINNEQEYYRFALDSSLTVGTLDRAYTGTSGLYDYRLNRSVYRLPVDTRLVRGVYSTATGMPLQFRDRAQFNSNFAARSQYGDPAYWTSYFDSDTDPPLTQIELFPVPTEVKAFSVDVAIDSAGLVPGQTSLSIAPWVRTGCLISGVSEDACLWMMTQAGVSAGLAAAADRHGAMFSRQLDDMVRSDVSRRGSTKLRGTPSTSRHRVARWSGESTRSTRP